VINFSIPRELDNYVHRIGRTARSGKTGFAMSLVTSSHRVLIGRIEAMTKSKMKEGKIPTRKEIGTKKVSAILKRFQDIQGSAKAIEIMGEDWKSAVAEMSREEIVGRFLSLSFPEVFAEREEAHAPKPMTRGIPEGVIISRGERSGGAGGRYGENRARRDNNRGGGFGRHDGGSKREGGFQPRRDFGGGRKFGRDVRAEGKGPSTGAASRIISPNAQGYAIRKKRTGSDAKAE